MSPKQQMFLRSKNLAPYMMSLDDLLTLKEIVDEELKMRQDITGKEQGIVLAQKVQDQTGNDQHIGELKEALFLARKQYAKRLSSMDEYRNLPGYAQRGMDGKIAEASEQNQVISPERTNDQSPQWKVSVQNPDGTERVIGYS